MHKHTLGTLRYAEGRGPVPAQKGPDPTHALGGARPGGTRPEEADAGAHIGSQGTDAGPRGCGNLTTPSRASGQPAAAPDHEKIRTREAIENLQLIFGKE